MPILHRGPDPLEMADVLRRLDALRRAPVPMARGWLPAAPEPPHPSVDLPTDVHGSATPTRRSSARWSDRLPSSLRINAVDPGRRGVAVLAIVALLGASGGLWYFVGAKPTSSRARDAATAATSPRPGTSSTSAAAPAGVLPIGWPTLSPSPGASAGASTSTSAPLVVDVVGKVVRPGVFTLAPNARILDAIAAAGGAVSGTDLTALDLASKVADGQEIFVGIAIPSGGQVGGVVGGGGAGAPAAGGAGTVAAVLDINAATVTELQTLPGIGAVMAERIIAWRAQHGSFASVAQLQQVSGIGPAKYAALAGRVRV